MPRWKSGKDFDDAMEHLLGSYDATLDALAENPDDEAAREFRDRILPLVDMELDARLEPMEAIPRLATSTEELKTLPLGPRAGFVLAQIDGQVCFDDIVDLSAMPRRDALRLLVRLLDDGVITR